MADKYIVQFGQINSAIWANIFYNDIFSGSHFDLSEQKVAAERRARKVGQFSERVKGSKFLINFFGRQFNPATDFFLDKHIL